MIQVPSTSNFTIALTIGDKYGKARLYLGFALLDERRCRPVSNDYMPPRFIWFSSMTTPSSVISYVQPLHNNQTQLTFAWFYVMLEEKSKCQWWWGWLGNMHGPSLYIWQECKMGVGSHGSQVFNTNLLDVNMCNFGCWEGRSWDWPLHTRSQVQVWHGCLHGITLWRLGMGFVLRVGLSKRLDLTLNISLEILIA